MTIDKVAEWETLWGIYVDKLKRFEDLKKQGRYGYQLRQPKKAVGIAAENLRKAFPVESKGLV